MKQERHTNCTNCERASRTARRVTATTALSVFVVLGVALLTSSCITDYRHIPHGAGSPADDCEITWRTYVTGIDLAAYSRTDPPLRLYFARVALDHPGVAVTTTPPNGPTEPLDTNGARTTTFARRSDAVLAVNASFFRPVRQNPGEPKDIQGLAIHEGVLYSAHEPTQDLIAFFPDGRAEIARTPETVSGARHAVAGAPVVLDDGRVPTRSLTPIDRPRHPRTAVGLDADGTTVYLLVAEGRLPRRSIGLTLRETGEWLSCLGATAGLNLDGGGSTTMVVRDAEGTLTTLNETVHDSFRGGERVVGNHLGFVLLELE